MKYIRMHQVEAEPMTHGDFMKAMGKTAEMMSEQDSKAEGYLVVYPDGYKSWCPKAQFEAAGRPCDGMTFGMAIEAMKRGKKVARKGWNGEGQFVRFEEVCVSHSGRIPANLNEVVGEVNWCFVFHFKNRHTGETGVQVGWLASQGDMKAEDWMIVE